jgi:hypothetical protein
VAESYATTSWGRTQRQQAAECVAVRMPCNVKHTASAACKSMISYGMCVLENTPRSVAHCDASRVKQQKNAQQHHFGLPQIALLFNESTRQVSLAILFNETGEPGGEFNRFKIEIETRNDWSRL